uniref:Uncharacterized protein n=1 Tax=Eristalis tenax TaxID=198635 RepID=A4VBA3_ERITN|nr:hypothetical protein [Eristalis tenax]
MNFKALFAIIFGLFAIAAANPAARNHLPPQGPSWPRPGPSTWPRPGPSTWPRPGPFSPSTGPFNPNPRPIHF